MTSPIPGPAPEGMPQPGPIPTMPPNGHAPQGEMPMQGVPAPYAPQVQVAPQDPRASFSAPTGEGWSGRGSCPGCGRATLSTPLRWCPSCRLAGRWPTSGPVPVFPESWWRFCGQI